MLISGMEALNKRLEQLQKNRERALRCELSAALSAQVNDAALASALTIGLPMAQGVRYRILRSRGRGIILTASIAYRQGVRMLEHWQTGGKSPLNDAEQAGLAAAGEIAAAAVLIKREEEKFSYLCDWICEHIRYAHTAPGRKGYERLVGAADVLADRQANCQGFADLTYLLCGLCGIECRICCGRGKRQLHVWNAVCLEGAWRDADVSRAARQRRGAEAGGEH